MLILLQLHALLSDEHGSAISDFRRLHLIPRLSTNVASVKMYIEQ